MSEEKATIQGKAPSHRSIQDTSSNTGAGSAVDAVPSSRTKLTLSQQAQAMVAATQNRPPAHTCRQALWICVFFDGTGNNLKADLHTLEHSNVARMFRAMPLDDESAGIFSCYVPGIGTLFPEIGDKGKGIIVDTHNAMGVMGQARLDWATKAVQDIITQAEARAQNPTNKIELISLAVFGFSRGATLARAFVRDLLRADGGKCIGDGKALRWRQGNHPLEIAFMGLWDTVAAVGAPIGANNVSALRRQRFTVGNAVRTFIYGDEVKKLRAVDLAFGTPGADPTQGPIDGHASWGDGLGIPPVVNSCVHMVAAHEVRNSFPVDSVGRGNARPSNCKEYVYPGVHSNVGGGYRPGEGGRGEAQPMDSATVSDADRLLSLIPLKAMYDEAVLAGVPLRKLNTRQWTKDNAADFSASPEMCAAFDHYMDIVGRHHATIGAAFLAHTRQYMAWRFHHIHEKQRVRPRLEDMSSDKRTEEESRISTSEKVWAGDQRQLDAEMAKLNARADVLDRQRLSEQLELSRSGRLVDPATLLPTREGQQRAAEINARYDPQIKTLRSQSAELQARKDTLPSQDKLIRGLSEYDAQLLEDARTILSRIEKTPTLRTQLRPHYKNLVEAYENEYVFGRGLDKALASDRTLIEFFDNYVHDSLANFLLDSTLPSDPRVIYAGGDFKVRFAQVGSPMTESVVPS